MSRKPYSGSQRKLVIGIDVGTTFSGVSYSILDPGIVPVIQGVNRYVGTSAYLSVGIVVQKLAGSQLKKEVGETPRSRQYYITTETAPFALLERKFFSRAT
jgi:molecular chaperone DnaK (HSP70)